MPSPRRSGQRPLPRYCTPAVRSYTLSPLKSTSWRPLEILSMRISRSRMCTERTMLACNYNHPACVETARNHLKDYKPIPTFTPSAGRQNIDTYNLLSITLRLAPTSTGQMYIAAFIMSCQCADDFVRFGKSLFWELFVPGYFVKE